MELWSKLRELLDPHEPERQRQALGERLTRTFDQAELEQAARTSRLPVEIAAAEQRLADAERALAQAPTAGLGEHVFIVSAGAVALAADAALAVAPAARSVGMALSDLSTASAGEIVTIVALPVLAGSFNFVTGQVGGEAFSTGELGAGLGATVLLVTTCGALALGRVGAPADLEDWAWLGFYTAAPAWLSLFVGVLRAKHARRVEPARVAARELAAAHEALGRRERELERAWDARTTASAALDRVEVGSVPPLRRPPGLPNLTGWTMTVSVLVGLGLVAFFANGCAEAGPVPAPSAYAILVDTSPSMASFDLGEAAQDAVRAGVASGFLEGGSALSVYETTNDGIAAVEEDQVVPRRFPGKGSPEAKREAWFGEVEHTLEGRSWPEGDSAVLRGLGRIGATFSLLPAEDKAVVLVSDCRDHLAGHYYLAKHVPKPAELVELLGREDALPNLDGVAVLACGMDTHPNEDGTPYTTKDNAALASAISAVVEAGGGTFTRSPSCSSSDLALTLNTLTTGGQK